MSDTDNTIRINAVIDIPESSLRRIMQSVKEIVKPDEKGIFHVDTADVVGELISDFIAQRDFDDFVGQFSNYRLYSGKTS